MGLSNLWHRRRRRRRRFGASSSEYHPPAVITIQKWVDPGSSSRRDGRRPSHGEDSLTNSAEDDDGVRRIPVQAGEPPILPHERVHESHPSSKRQERPTNVAVQTKLIMKEDRICGMVETTGEKLRTAVELAAMAIFALVVVATSILLTVWCAVVVVAWHHGECWTILLVALGCLLASVTMGALLVRWIQQYIQKKTTPNKKKKSNESFVARNSIATWTDVSDLAE